LEYPTDISPGPLITYKLHNAGVLSVEHSGKEAEFVEDILFTFETIDVLSKSKSASLARQN
jgi:type VI protein secretion system component Hcp